MILEKFKQVKAFVFDVDGVFTNGNILVNELGEQWRTFNVKDGYAFQAAVKAGYPVLIVTGGKSIGVKIRFEKLGAKEVYLNTSNKLEVAEEWAKRQALDLKEVLFMGDDIPDLEMMETAGLATCPADAVEEVKVKSAYISPFEGGKGAVRDVIKKVMVLQGKWVSDSKIKSI